MPVSKARGRKASIQAMAAKVGGDGVRSRQADDVHQPGDCLQDAEYLAELLKQQYHVPEVAINYVGR